MLTIIQMKCNIEQVADDINVASDKRNKKLS